MSALIVSFSMHSLLRTIMCKNAFSMLIRFDGMTRVRCATNNYVVRVVQQYMKLIREGWEITYSAHIAITLLET